MTRYEPTIDEVQAEALKSQCRADAEDRYFEEHPQPFLDKVGEVGRELEEAHRAFTKKAPF